MDLDIKFDCIGVDWQVVAETLKRVGMARFKNAAAMSEKGFTE